MSLHAFCPTPESTTMPKEEPGQLLSLAPSSDFQKIALMGNDVLFLLLYIYCVRKKGTNELFCMKTADKGLSSERKISDNEKFSTLEKHPPFILKMHHVFENEKGAHFVFDLATGGNLGMYMQHWEKMALRDKADLHRRAPRIKI